MTRASDSFSIVAANDDHTTGRHMVTTRLDDEQTKQLTHDELDEVRDCWGMGVPLPMLAAQQYMTEQELRVQLREPAWQRFDCEVSR